MCQVMTVEIKKQRTKALRLADVINFRPAPDCLEPGIVVKLIWRAHPRKGVEDGQRPRHIDGATATGERVNIGDERA